MVKLFISQPMRGKTDEEILTVRNKAIASAKKNMKEFGYEGEDVEVIESFFLKILTPMPNLYITWLQA